MSMPSSYVAPDEHDDPRNMLLEAFDAQVEAMIENGFELQLRNRLARLLPAPKPEPDLFSARPVADPNAELEAVTVIRDCDALARKPMSAISHQAIQRLKARFQTELETLRAGRAG